MDYKFFKIFCVLLGIFLILPVVTYAAAAESHDGQGAQWHRVYFGNGAQMWTNDPDSSHRLSIKGGFLFFETEYDLWANLDIFQSSFRFSGQRLTVGNKPPFDESLLSQTLNSYTPDDESHSNWQELLTIGGVEVLINGPDLPLVSAMAIGYSAIVRFNTSYDVWVSNNGNVLFDVISEGTIFVGGQRPHVTENAPSSELKALPAPTGAMRGSQSPLGNTQEQDPEGENDGSGAMEDTAGSPAAQSPTASIAITDEAEAAAVPGVPTGATAKAEDKAISNDEGLSRRFPKGSWSGKHQDDRYLGRILNRSEIGNPHSLVRLPVPVQIEVRGKRQVIDYVVLNEGLAAKLPKPGKYVEIRKEDIKWAPTAVNERTPNQAQVQIKISRTGGKRIITSCNTAMAVGFYYYDPASGKTVYVEDPKKRKSSTASRKRDSQPRLDPTVPSMTFGRASTGGSLEKYPLKGGRLSRYVSQAQQAGHQVYYASIFSGGRLVSQLNPPGPAVFKLSKPVRLVKGTVEYVVMDEVLAGFLTKSQGGIAIRHEDMKWAPKAVRQYAGKVTGIHVETGTGRRKTANAAMITAFGSYSPTTNDLDYTTHPTWQAPSAREQ